MCTFGPSVYGLPSWPSAAAQRIRSRHAVTTDVWRAFRDRRNPASKAPVDVRALCDVDERARVLGGDEQQRPRGAGGCPSALFPLLQRAN